MNYTFKKLTHHVNLKQNYKRQSRKTYFPKWFSTEIWEMKEGMTQSEIPIDTDITLWVLTLDLYMAQVMCKDLK